MPRGPCDQYANTSTTSAANVTRPRVSIATTTGPFVNKCWLKLELRRRWQRWRYNPTVAPVPAP